jgi:hypothetical protein
MAWLIQLPEGQASLSDGTYVIGRAADAQIRLTDMTVSGRHAQLRVHGHQAVLCDLGSTNGTMVAGQTLSPNLSVEVPDGASVTIGTVAITLHQQVQQPTGDGPRRPSVSPGAYGQRRQAGAAAGGGAMGGSAGSIWSDLRDAVAGVGAAEPSDSLVNMVTSPTYLRSIWVSAAAVVVALFLPWVDVIFGTLDYLEMWRLASDASSVASAFGQDFGVSLLALPGLAAIAALGTLVTAFLRPEKSPGSALGSGLVGLAGAVAVYLAFASSTGLDLTGALGTGFYVFLLGSLAMVCIGIAGVWAGHHGHRPRHASGMR